MKKRIRLCDRQLPRYCRGEEIMNMVTHIVGGGLGVIALILCLWRSGHNRDGWALAGSLVYGISMITLYTMSSVYHGLRPGMGKKVLQILDHCTIYFLIAGTYTVLALSALRRVSPALCLTVLAVQWGLTALAIVLNAIDLKRYKIFSMICYIGMGWFVAICLPQTITALTMPGFLWLLAGGIAYTIGAILFGIGAKVPWMHSVFHIFVVLGSILQFISIYFYAL